MKVLLLGEYSNVHWVLAQGLRYLGNEVTVASNGDRFKNYRRDIDLTRKSHQPIDTIRYVTDLVKNFRNFKGYDVVQIVNPFFLDLKANRNLSAFNYLKKNNGKIFLGAFGDDSYWLKTCLERKAFRYSEFDVPERANLMPAAQKLADIWSDPDKINANKIIAQKADGIIACLYEYYVSYKNEFAEKLTYIPEPVEISEIPFVQRGENPQNVSFFIGIQKHRNEIKGTDIMLRALQKINLCYPGLCSVKIAESVPNKQYNEMMAGSDILLDQLYSYTPGMNALTAMASGMVVVGGGEPEIYDLLGESRNHPVINVLPSEKDVFDKLDTILKNREQIKQQSLMSRQFIEKHHDNIKIARQYIDFWKKT